MSAGRDPPRSERRAERLAMVREQLAARGIRSRRVLATMLRVPRHAFVPPALAAQAYDDGPLPIGSGQTISQPYIVALMTEALDLHRTDRVLEIGTGSGYQTAVLAALAREVFSVERLPALSEAALERLRSLGIRNVLARVGDGSEGWPLAAPFDAIIVTAAAPAVPTALAAQLAPGRRLVVPVGGGERQELLVVTAGEGRLATRSEGPVRFVPLLGREGFQTGAAGAEQGRKPGGLS